MRLKEVQCTRCGKSGNMPRYFKGEYICPECKEAIADEEREKKYAQELQEKTFNKELMDSLRKREEFDNFVDYCIYFAVMMGASDLHLHASRPPVFRKGKALFNFTEECVKSEDVFDFSKKYNLLVKDYQDTLKTFDFALELNGNRFRCNTYHEINGWCCALRLINPISTDFEKLRIPLILKSLVKKQSGLILITGPTGSGKSTTMSALIQYLNETDNKHVITIEDPIEFVYPKGKCIITQRELGNDAASYEDAIVDSLREDPDIIVIGEMRDMESVEAAIRAVETGHIVISTLHTRGSASTINRIVDVFPPEKQDQVRSQLALNLQCCVTQQLVPTLNPGELTLATEIMIANDAIRSSIRDNKLHIIGMTIELNQQAGMHTMKQDLERLKNQHIISQTNFEKYQIK